MSDIHLPSAADSDDDGQQPEVRLELTRAGVEQVLSLYSQEQESSRAEGGFSIRLEDLLEATRKRRKMIAAGFVTGLGLGVAGWLLSTPLYPVSAQVVLERYEVSSTSIDGGPGAGGSAFIATQAEVMKSRSVVEAAVATIPRASHLEPEADPASDAMKSVEASPVSGTQVVALGYLGPDPQHGVRLLGAIVDTYRTRLRDLEQETQSQKLSAKQAEIDVLEAEAIAVEERIQALRDANDMLGSADDAASAQAAILREHTEQLTEIRRQRITLENRLLAGGQQLAILDPATRSLQEQLWTAEAELAEARLSLKSRHPAVEAAQQRVTVLRQQLETNANATPDALKRDIAASLGLERQLQAAYEEERERMATIERFRREERLLTTELERIRNMADVRRRAMLDQRLVTRLAESGEVGVTARVIEAPTAPEGPAWPRPKLMLAGGGFVGLVGGLGAALISLRRQREREVWDAPPAAPGGGKAPR